jgi:thiamine-phosphate pyrophosphorylase
MRAWIWRRRSAMSGVVMDSRLVAWARAVKARHRRAADPALPVLWLFTDAQRLPDPRDAVARLPAGLCGVVLRHDAAPDRSSLACDLAAICRARRLVLVVAGDPRLAAAVHAGTHLRGGRLPRGIGRAITSSAHSVPDLRRAGRAGCRAVFLSPVFQTASHPGAPALGAARWSRMARSCSLPVLALGGVTGHSARGLPRRCRGAGAIGALA